MRTRFSLGDANVASMGEGNAAVFDGVLGREVALGIRAAALRARAVGHLRPAGIGRRAGLAPGVRGDQIAWLDPDALLDPALGPALHLFEAVRRVMNEIAYLGAHDTEVQLAVYDTAAGYDRHFDCIRDTDERRLTAVYYANPWRPGDGGELEVWEPASVRRIEPVADRLVLFRSAGVAHRVCPVTGPPRVAVSGWLRR